ncbi:MAG TPA: chemotaxis response regulator protein-glutamate methylesterase [Acetobacteraceae bacterium]|nr:chemotaxis response regulator protein-glutamate methylesterase [Acetobacteraceae bacterium]
MNQPIRVLVCDDSAVLRGAIARALEADPAIRVVARAANGAEAVQAVSAEPVDVAVLDIEMPVMDGLTALPKLIEAAPGVRVLMASTLTTRGAEVTLRALRLGAADYVAKPSALAPDAAAAFRAELLAKVRALAPRPAAAAPTPAFTLRPVPRGFAPLLLAIGASTGGPQALFTLVQGLGRDVRVPVVLTQHMPPAFTATLAGHIARLGVLPCTEAEDQAPLLPGRIYVAPGERHLLVVRQGGGFAARLSDMPAVNFCRPSVDPMLQSAAEAACGRVLAAILTGMGHDGLAGVRRVVEAGGVALAQDAATSVVWGMPGAVARAGLCHAVLPLGALAPTLRALLGAR